MLRPLSGSTAIACSPTRKLNSAVRVFTASAWTVSDASNATIFSVMATTVVSATVMRVMTTCGLNPANSARTS